MPPMYQVIARKYRPQSFEDVVGQEHVTGVIKNAIECGRIPHAFIFSGPRGVGKTSVARILAKTLSCEKGPGTKPCNECPICNDITASRAIDVFEIDAASHTGVENIRELIENSRYAPTLARYKTFIIDEAHMLSKSAFNALLKTLEEPPSHVIFILATTELNKIPVTVLSRCQSYDFRRISIDEIIARLRDVAGNEGAEITDSALTLIAIQADGSMRDAQGILERIIAVSRESIRVEDIERLLGLLSMSTKHEILNSLIKRDASKLISLVDDVYKFGYDLLQLYKNLIEQFRNMMVIKTGYENIPLPKEEIGFLKELTADISFEEIHRALSVLIKSETDMKFSSLQKITLETILLRIISSPRLIDINRILSTGIKESDELTGGIEKRERSFRQMGHFDMNTDKTWDNFRDYLKMHEPPLFSIISSAVLVKNEGHEYTVGVTSDFQAEQIRRDHSEIEEKASLYFKKPAAIKVEIIEKQGKVNVMKPSEVRAKAVNMQIVKDVMSEFNGTITNVKQDQ